MPLEPITGHGHFHAGLVKLIPPLWGKPRIASLLFALLNQVQRIEDVAWQVLNAYNIETADDTRLDVLGRIVGIFRQQSWTTEEFRRVLRGKMRANRSNGNTDDIVEVISLVMGLESGEHVIVEHYVPATVVAYPDVTVSSDDLTGLEFLLPQTRAAGVRMHLEFQLADNVSLSDFIPESAISAVSSPAATPTWSVRPM